MPINMTIDRKTTKDRALKILSELNALIRGKNYTKMCGSKEYERLNEKINDLGWLALAKEQSIVATATDKELRVQLKLVSPDSEKAKEVVSFLIALERIKKADTALG